MVRFVDEGSGSEPDQTEESAHTSSAGWGFPGTGNGSAAGSTPWGRAAARAPGPIFEDKPASSADGSATDDSPTNDPAGESRGVEALNAGSAGFGPAGSARPGAGPTGSEQAGSPQAGAGPVSSGPVGFGPAGSGPVSSGPVGSELAGSERVGSEPVGSEPVSARSGSVRRAAPRAASADSAASDAAETRSGVADTAESALGTGPAAPAETLAPVISLASRWASRAESGDSPAGAGAGAGAESAPEAASIDAPAEATRPRLRALNTPPAPVAAAAEAPPAETASPAVSGQTEAETARPLRAAVIAAETPVTGLAPVSRFPALGAVPEEPALPAFVEYDDPEPEEEEPEPVDPEWALDQLVRRLARRGLSRAEVLTAARDLGLDEEQAEQVRERLDDLGYLDDAVLAEEIKHSLYDRKGKSRTVVAREMAQRKIPQEVITEVLSSVEDDDELAAATELAIKRIGQLSSYDDATVDRRLSGFLSRRGYNGQIVRAAIKAAMSSRGSRVRFR